MSFLVDYKPQNTNNFTNYVKDIVNSAKQGFVDQASMVKTTYPSAPGLNTGAMGAAKNPVNPTSKAVSYLSDPAWNGGAGSGLGDLGAATGFTKSSNGNIGFADPNYQAAMDMINQISKANNEWSAEQAQKQMDFQKMMSDTAHQREVEDLKKAGLNPVLSSGGNGASTPTGAMAMTDDSNTRLIAELAYSTIEAIQNTAIGVGGAAAAAAGAAKSDGKSGSLWSQLSGKYKNDKLFAKAVNTGMSAAQYALGGFGAKLLIGML